MRIHLRVALAAALTLIPAGTALAQEPVEPAGPDAWTSPNVEYLGSIKQDVGLTTGARVVPSTEPGVPDKLFVHNAKNFTIYDISNPAKPKTMGTIHLNVAWEGEEIPTDGKLVVLADDYLIADPMCGNPAVGLATQQFSDASEDGCVQFFDVRDPSNVKEVGAVRLANHTAECAAPEEDATDTCEYVYGSAGTIIDARGALKGQAPTVIGNWITEMKAQGANERSCHHIRQLRPGVLLSACQPFAAMSINASDGGSPAHPVLLADGASPKFVHSARWPRGGRDKFLLTGGELNFQGRCELNDSEFKVFSAEKVLRGESQQFEGPVAQATPTNGIYVDGNAPAGELGCSEHWFQEHPSFHDGGLVALSQYENGVKFLQITPSGQIKQKGFFISAASSSSSPKWAPDGRTLYSIDYHRGIDIVRYNGCLYVPGKPSCGPGELYGTDDAPPAAALRAARRGQAKLLAQMRAVGWFPGYCQLIAQRTNGA
ncbi:MAG: hypothetical protein QOJ29_3205 [Thermoleophilaceae bacterium]|jgi:hypothetical protein|nr:hypothetical protein [Thermoleophilaceae bacterium]